MTNVITANLAKSRFYRCPPLYQYNYGMILKITGVELPTAYEVDFANDISGSSITQIGGADGVTIPDQLFVPGQAIYCWLREHPTPDSSVTTAITVIPISSRATITDEEPTPEEQSAIDEAIAALNTAVEHVDDAVEHYPTITGGVWYVWDVDSGEYVSTGVPAQGAQGNPGVDGQDGQNGTDGTDAYVYIRYAANEPTADADMKTTPDAWIGIYSGDAATAPTPYTSYTWYKIKGETGAAGAVQDVQVNGTSILNNGVANVPIASNSEFGAVKIGDGYGVYVDSTSKGLRISKSDENMIKTGTHNFRPIVPYSQHISTFYGLAKASGADMASSSNPVGTYTDAAKIAIQKMLGIYEAPWELIREDTVTHTTSELLDITVDGNGQAFELTDIRLLIQVPTQETDFVISSYATVAAYYGTTDKISFVGIGNSTYTIAANSSNYAMLLEIGWEKGMSKMEGMLLQKETGRTNMQTGLYFSPTSTNREFLIGNNAFSKIRIPDYSGTLKYRLYGKRKWQ